MEREHGEEAGVKREYEEEAVEDWGGGMGWRSGVTERRDGMTPK